MKTQKRLKSAWIVLGLNLALFSLGILKGSGLTDLGAGLAMVNAPVLIYILGESFRPSKVETEKENV